MQSLFPSEKDTTEKIEPLLQAITVAEQAGNVDEEVSLRKQLGQVYMDQGDAPQALTEFNEALKLLKGSDQKETQSQLLGFRGLALKLIGNYAQALQSFRKANALALEIDHTALIVDSYIQIAALYSEAGKFVEAHSALTKALGRSETKKDKIRMMRLNGLLGDNYLKRVEAVPAAEHFQAAVEYAQDLKNLAAQCSFVTKLGNVLLLQGKTDRSIQKYERALALATEIEDRNAEINALGGLFRAYALAGDVHPATVYGQQAIHLASTIAHYEAEVANIQALTAYLVEQGQIDKVFPLIERGLEITKEQANLGLEMELLSLQGQAYALQEDYEAAIASWEAGLEQASMVQDEALMAMLQGRLAAVYAETGRLEKSTAAGERALELALSVDNPRLAAQQHLLLALNFSEMGRREKAVQHCASALAAFHQLGEQSLADQAQGLHSQLLSQA